MARRLIFISPLPVARIFAFIYAGLGLVGFLFFAFSNARYYTLPFGVLGPLFHLNLNFNLARPDYPFSFVFLCLAGVVSYAATGWLTGIVTISCFNFIAKKLGGINEEYFSFRNDEDATSSSQNHEAIREAIHQPGAGN